MDRFGGDDNANFQLAPPGVRERSQEEIGALCSILSSHPSRRGDVDLRKIVHWLSPMQPFDGQPAKALRLAARACRLEVHPRDHKIFRRGEPADKFYMVVAGSLSVFAENENVTLGGRKVPELTAMLSTGDAVGGSTIASPTTQIWTITALASTPVQLLSLGYVALQRILETVASEKFAKEKRFTRTVPFLSDLSDAKVERFFSFARKRVLPPATVFWRPGAFVGNVWLIQHGRVRFCWPSQEGGGEAGGRRHPSAIEGDEACELGSGALVGGSSFFERHGRYTVHAIASSRVVAWELLKLAVPRALDESVRAAIDARAARLTRSDGADTSEYALVAPSARTPGSTPASRPLPAPPPPPPIRRRPASAWVRLSSPQAARPSRRPASAASHFRPSSTVPPGGSSSEDEGGTADPDVRNLLELRAALRTSAWDEQGADLDAGSSPGGSLSPPRPASAASASAARLAASASAASLGTGTPRSLLLRSRISSTPSLSAGVPARPASASAASLRSRPWSAASFLSAGRPPSEPPPEPAPVPPLQPLPSDPAVAPPPSPGRRTPRDEDLEGEGARAVDRRVLEVLHPPQKPAPLDPYAAARPKIAVPFRPGSLPHHLRPTSASSNSRSSRALALSEDLDEILAHVQSRGRAPAAAAAAGRPQSALSRGAPSRPGTAGSTRPL
eukprot:tig00021742_g23329.t1